MKRVKRFGVYQTSKVVAIILFFASLILIIPFGLIARFAIGNHFPGFPFGGGIFLIILPIVYGLMGFITTAVGCFIYNLVAKRTGGIELEFEVVDESTESVE